MELVRFMVDMKEGADANEIKTDLESRAKDLSIQVQNLKSLGLKYVFGRASQKTYENVFEAKVEYQTKTIPNINRGPYQVQEWVEVRDAKVPDNLKDKIEKIYLEPKFYLTD